MQLKGMNGCCKLVVLVDEPNEPYEPLYGGLLLTINKNNEHYSSYKEAGDNRTSIPLTKDTELLIIRGYGA